jgi:hypothetical protein
LLLEEYHLLNLPASFTISGMATKVSAEVLKLVRKQLASAGGKARAKKYDEATLSKWGARGGRPKKTKAAPRRKRGGK